MAKFSNNELAFDKHAKELVLISNGVDTTLDGKPQDFVPTEAIALRFLGLTQDGRPALAWTYRKVDAAQLDRYCGSTTVEEFRNSIPSHGSESYKGKRAFVVCGRV